FARQMEMQAVNQPESAASPGFGSTLTQMVKEVNRLQAQADQLIEKQTINGTEDFHEVMLAMEKAGLSFKFLSQVRNKLIQAYEEIMRIAL
ncbi:MAG: flagellar hook-basal body complex protein FliE, partial [Desulfobacca sp.]|nr:flagellar hook-basal body complex protein FliE [Desulfobacca sp.]